MSSDAVTLDRIDRKILAALMADSTLSIAALAERVGLSQTPCWKRVQKLEGLGIITGRVALVDPRKIGLGLTVFVEIEAADHSATWRDTFAGAMMAQPEVIELHRMAGDVDYLLKVMVPDMAAYDAFYQRMTREHHCRNVTSKFTMERMKTTTALPINTTDV